MSKPYEKFGKTLKNYRKKADESIRDVSDAVEIQPDFLESIEQGDDRPSEDILALLITHFNLDTDAATKMWSLAGYNHVTQGGDMDSNDELNIHVPADEPVLYTDMVHVISNKYGVTLNFVQGIGPNGKPVVVSRVGMSREHAESVLEVLKKSLEKQD